MTNHPSDAQLNELVDGRLGERDAVRVQRHVAECVPCASTVRTIEALVRRARALPRELPPPADAWEEVRRVRQQGSRRATAVSAAPRARWPMLAAAAALVALSSATTWWMLDGGAEPGRAPDSYTEAVPPAALTAFAPVEARYVLAASALRATLDERRDVLDPATVAAVEQSLATIDEAIAEARAALARDPADATLTRLLASSYEQKVTLLRRASELPPRS